MIIRNEWIDNYFNISSNKSLNWISNCWSTKQRPKLKQTKSYHLPSKKYLRLYEDYKFKETYLEALKILYQIREGDNCPFHPVINNNKCYMTFKTENSIINNRIKKLKINKFT